MSMLQRVVVPQIKHIMALHGLLHGQVLALRLVEVRVKSNLEREAILVPLLPLAHLG